ncbi:dnaJ homolog subfamily C member 28 [Aethina tumida]|uniref:dnaJ homolog subfamily C member 28 n=1 Tax=Aethina tumida TaxID=116153 RepID=UPI00096B4C4B|nr:dnaJ homolog subfamily C member 28 [Aethina tumida]XP_019880871.1 dnaJ homolog subfamily C member 28 [Aethina tumida]
MAVHIFVRRFFLNNYRHFSTKFSKLLEYKKCCKILGVKEGCDQEEIRSVYLKLVKIYHPDSGNPEANSDKFHEIDKAFKTLINRKAEERWDVDEAVIAEQDIKHTAPQHRQYLSYGGIGSGTPFQREKQYTKVRAMQAAENVYQHRVAKVTAEENTLMDKAPLKHKIKTKYGFDRLVEDLIQESMSKGEFSNLSGAGKPLRNEHNRNPYVDFVTHKLNEVLIDNGFTPEWITLQKEIRSEAHHLRTILFYERQFFSPFPLNTDENIIWSEIVYKYKQMVDEINKKIAKFNLVVPVLDKQMIQISLEKEAQKAIKDGKSFKDLGLKRPVDKNERRNDIKEVNITNFFSFIDSFFKNK